MSNFTKREMNTLVSLLKMSELEVINTMANELSRTTTKENMIITPNFIYRKGSIPITLVAHSDIMLQGTNKTLLMSKEYICLENNKDLDTCLGADDRAGVFVILELAKKYDVNVLIVTAEEIGSIGTSIFLNHYLYQTFARRSFFNTNIFIQLDRRGEEDAVYYKDIGKKIRDYVSPFGFIEATGTFSDISDICPEFRISGVNLSVGYLFEHSSREILILADLKKTMDRVERMILSPPKEELLYCDAGTFQSTTYSDYTVENSDIPGYAF